MRRKTLLLVVPMLLLLISCQPEPIGEEGHLAGGEHTFKKFELPAEETLTLDGDVVIIVERSAEIEGTITGDCTEVEFRVEGDFTLLGQLTNTCSDEVEEAPDIRIIVDGDAVLGTEGETEPIIVTDGSLFISDSISEEIDLEPVLLEDPDEAFRKPSGGPKNATPLQQAGGGIIINQPANLGPGGTIDAVHDQGTVVVNANLTAQPGKEGDSKDLSPCDASGNRGGRGGSIRLGTRAGTLEIGPNVILKAGDGGQGGSCTAQGDPATAIAGPGGKGGSVLLGGPNIKFGAGVTIKRANGGPGGDAVAEGDSADEACEPGSPADATGGKGGNAGGIGYVILEPGSIDGQPTVEGGNGGTGGLAAAKGGDGEKCDVCPAGEGGAGGKATANGGQGGDGARRSLGWTIAPNSHKKGDGGPAAAVGGNGGEGAICCLPPQTGGNGGIGGEAEGIGGEQGRRGLNDGQVGSSIGSITGDGGDGGDGLDPGFGGPEGDGVAVPDPVLFGDPGEDGEICTVKDAILFLAYFSGAWEHFGSWSNINFLLFLLGDDPVPVPGATVTIVVEGESGFRRTVRTTTGLDGVASGEITIFAYDTYTVRVESIEGENMVYDPSLNEVADSFVLEVTEAEGQVPEISESLIRAFLGGLTSAMRTPDPDFLLDRLNPAVISIYGNTACRNYTGSLEDPTFRIVVQEISGPAPWDWVRDEVTTPIPLAYTVMATVTQNGEKEDAELHLSIDKTGVLRWFTDCGDPR